MGCSRRAGPAQAVIDSAAIIRQTSWNRLRMMIRARDETCYCLGFNTRANEILTESARALRIIMICSRIESRAAFGRGRRPCSINDASALQEYAGGQWQPVPCSIDGVVL